MTKSLRLVSAFAFCSALFLSAPGSRAQQPAPTASPIDSGAQSILADLVATPAVSGYENPLGDKILHKLSSLHATKDNLGDVIVTIGSGSPAA